AGLCICSHASNCLSLIDTPAPWVQRQHNTITHRISNSYKKGCEMSNIGRIRSAILSSVLGLGAVLASQPALEANDRHTKPIEVIVPYTPGGSTDTVARVVMKELEERLGQPIIIQNRPGANSTIGTAQATRAKPDGYTFLMI